MHAHAVVCVGCKVGIFIESVFESFTLSIGLAGDDKNITHSETDRCEGEHSSTDPSRCSHHFEVVPSCI